MVFMEKYNLSSTQPLSDEFLEHNCGGHLLFWVCRMAFSPSSDNNPTHSFSSEEVHLLTSTCDTAGAAIALFHCQDTGVNL